MDRKIRLDTMVSFPTKECNNLLIRIHSNRSLVPGPSAPRPVGKLEREKRKEGLVKWALERMSRKNVGNP